MKILLKEVHLNQFNKYKNLYINKEKELEDLKRKRN